MAGVENTHHKGCYDAKLCMWSISTSPWACCYRVTSGQGELLVSLITGIEELGWSKGHMAAPKSKIPQASSPSHSVSVVMMCYMWKKIPPWRRWGRSKQHFCLAYWRWRSPSTCSWCHRCPRALGQLGWPYLWAPSRPGGWAGYGCQSQVGCIAPPQAALASASFLGRRKLARRAGSSDGTASSGRGQGQEFVFNLLLVYLSWEEGE